MPINADKPHLWKADIIRSVDYYNDWFMRFAPDVYREQRARQASIVEHELKRIDYLRAITPIFLKEHPSVLPVLRMATAPPLARDRLIGLAYVSSNLVYSIEGKEGRPSGIPPRMRGEQLMEELGRICDVVKELADVDLFSWLASSREPSTEESYRAATILADRLCGSIADPIIRNAQEKRQVAAIRNWLEAQGYSYFHSSLVADITQISPGSYTFIYNVLSS